MSSFGKLEEFSPQKETITNYLERIEIFFLANAVADEKEVPVFLSVVGGNIYALLRSLLAPAKPQDKSFDALPRKVVMHLSMYSPTTPPPSGLYGAIMGI